MKKIICLLLIGVFGACGSFFSGCSNGTTLTPKEFVQKFVDFELPHDMELEYKDGAKNMPKATMYYIFRFQEEPTEMLKNFAPPSEFTNDGEDIFIYGFLVELEHMPNVDKNKYPNFDENYLCYQSNSGKTKNGEMLRGNMKFAYFTHEKKLYTLGGWD